MSAKKKPTGGAESQTHAEGGKSGKTKPAPRALTRQPEIDQSEGGRGADGDTGNSGRSGNGGSCGDSHHVVRQKTAELATRLVCAQITATAQYRAARHLAKANLNVAEALLMGFARLNIDFHNLAAGISMDLLDAGYMERALHHLRQSASAVKAMPGDTPALDHPELDDVFAAAMQRAGRLLGPPGEDRTIVHAEQLFQPDAVLTEKAMEDVFADWHWPVLRNRATFVNKMKRLEDWYAARYGHLLSSVEGTEEEDDLSFIEHAIDFLQRHDGDERYENLKNAIDELLIRHTSRKADAASQERLWDDAWQRHLILRIFNGRVPGHREKNATREYNAWGLFRYLRMFGADDPAAKSLLSDFRSERRELNPEKHPGPIGVSPARCFGQLGEMAESRLFSDWVAITDHPAVEHPAVDHPAVEQPAE